MYRYGILHQIAPEFLFFQESLVSGALLLKRSEILFDFGLQHAQHLHLKRPGENIRYSCDVAQWRLSLHYYVAATFLGSIPASADIVESEWRQMTVLNI